MENRQAPRIYPTLRYDDAPGAIRFLTDAFGFTARRSHRIRTGAAAMR